MSNNNNEIFVTYLTLFATLLFVISIISKKGQQFGWGLIIKLSHHKTLKMYKIN